MDKMSLTTLTAPSVTTTLIEGRRQWVAGSAADLIRMFAAAGFDVVRGYRLNGEHTRDPNVGGKEIRTAREVMMDGRAVAYILWHDDVPGFAFANTYKDFNDIAI